MKVENMRSLSSGRDIANQFIITDIQKVGEEYHNVEIFQSYQSAIVKRAWISGGKEKIYLDCRKWDYSRTTGRYRNQFLGETKMETQRKIHSGEYELVDLN